MGPGDREALRVEAPFETMEARGPVEVMLEIVLAGPDRLHRRADFLRDLGRLHRVVCVEPPAEAASQKRHVDGDRPRRQTGRRHHVAQDPSRDLCRRPDLAAILGDVRGGVLRLHGGVRLERQFVDSLDPLHRRGERRRGVAFVDDGLAG